MKTRIKKIDVMVQVRSRTQVPTVMLAAQAGHDSSMVRNRLNKGYDEHGQSEAMAVVFEHKALGGGASGPYNFTSAGASDWWSSPQDWWSQPQSWTQHWSGDQQRGESASKRARWSNWGAARTQPNETWLERHDQQSGRAIEDTKDNKWINWATSRSNRPKHGPSARPRSDPEKQKRLSGDKFQLYSSASTGGASSSSGVALTSNTGVRSPYQDIRYQYNDGGDEASDHSSDDDDDGDQREEQGSLQSV